MHECGRRAVRASGLDFLCPSRLGLLFFHEAVPVEVQFPQFLQPLVRRAVRFRLVGVAHGVLGDGLRVRLVVLAAAQPAAALDFQRGLAPDGEALGVQLLAQQAVVPSCGLGAVEAVLLCRLGGLPHPCRQFPYAVFAVLECLIASDFMPCFCLFDDGRVKFFFRDVDSDKHFFHSFVPYLVIHPFSRGDWLETALVLLL